ncbi:hypothetical protein NN561_005125 [Cricetulus griseus]
MGLSRAGTSLGDAGAVRSSWLQSHWLGEGIGGSAGDLISQKPCVTPQEIEDDVSSGQEHSAASGGSARKGGLASAGERAGHAQARTSVSSSSAKDMTGDLGVGVLTVNRLGFPLTPAPRPYAFPAGWHSATVTV